MGMVTRWLQSIIDLFRWVNLSSNSLLLIDLVSQLALGHCTFRFLDWHSRIQHEKRG
jgi:hypothetical protein